MNTALKERLISLAREAGFAECAFAGITPVIQQGELHPQAQALSGEVQSLMPDAQCIMLMAMPYQPFEIEHGQAHVDAYYLTSNRAHESAKLLAQRIEETLHIRTMPSPPVYIKPLAVRCGLGEFGRNSLISVKKYGTRVSLQAIALDVSIETHDNSEKPLSSLCAKCGLCVSACPTHALDGTGRVDISRCLRAQTEGEAFPEAMRAHLGGSILGCDLCQRVCPRNARVLPIRSDPSLRAALDLAALLRGEYKPLIPFLGKNNARRQRLTARALIAAANLDRTDLLPLIEPLIECRESEMVRSHAAWAKQRLTEKIFFKTTIK